MYDGDRHRPLEQWFRLNETSTSVFIDDSAFELRLERDVLEKFTPKVGGFGVVYHCDAVQVKSKVSQKAIVKHMHYDGSGDETQLPQLNEDLDNEIALIRRVEMLNLTPPLLAEFTFKAYESGSLYRMFLQQEASGQSLYDLKDFMPTSQRIELLWNIFNQFNLLHTHGLYHTDLDLRHIYWDEEAQSIQIIDWGGGFYHDPSDSSEFIGRKLKHGGKEYYVSHEQRKRDFFTPRSEVYLLGSLVYFFLTDDNNGDASPEYENNDNPDGIALDSIRGDGNIPDFLRKLVYKATRWDPADRFESVAAMIEFWKTSCEPLVGSILAVHTTRGEAFIVDEKKNNLALDPDLAIVGDYSSSIPTWKVDGMCEYLVQHGSSIGEWKSTHSQLNIYHGPMLIRSALSGEVYLLKVTRASISSFEASDSEPPFVENSALYQCNSTGDIVVILVDNGDTLSLKNQFTQEIKGISREDFDQEYTEI
jgi:serine/threonine protein kinase